ncbi:ubiquinol-cytochrome C chaperone family protein [Kaistia terrae]|uniref:Ubiquinol-cytochrome C chaperone family protein n=1 Tax=Kaistia terrae TaxID=537017 RepID=A0ABW0PS34_9HYPH|nr:ubiquinol-cytochrome C chaperone family protein [Kaistia terrae]MCX5577545.1 ubiquinol-cytochrome C chaperone [Kaistia terrae]
MFRRLFTRNRRNEAIAYSLYGAIVAQARQPALYTEFAVPDTLDGRFDMVVLHGFLLFHRLKAESADDRQVGQDVFDIFLKDMDGTLREMGVGDISVPKKLKKMAEAFFGRIRAYDEALLSGDRAKLVDAIERNVFPDGAPAGVGGRIAGYMEAAVGTLAAQSLPTIFSGKLDYSPLPSSSAAA